MAKELDKKYDPSQVEDRIYDFWLSGGYFHAEIDPDKKPYTIVTVSYTHLIYAKNKRKLPVCG